MNRAERRHRRGRVIAWRQCKIRAFQRDSYYTNAIQRWSPVPGRLSKWNLTCGCSACRREKYRDKRQQYKREALDLSVRNESTR
jgi:hypothetical protein